MISTGHEPTYTAAELNARIKIAIEHDRKKRKWVGLTDEEIVYELGADNEIDIAWAHEIEAKLKQKNGYVEEKNT